MAAEWKRTTETGCWAKPTWYYDNIELSRHSPADKNYEESGYGATYIDYPKASSNPVSPV